MVKKLVEARAKLIDVSVVWRGNEGVERVVQQKIPIVRYFI